MSAVASTGAPDRQGGWLQDRYVAAVLALAIVLACAASTLLSLQMIRFTLNTIFIADQWETVDLYERSLQGLLSFRDLIAQHNEHRIFFPRLIYLLDYAIDDGRNRVNYAAIVLIQVVHVALFVGINFRIGASYALQIALASFVTLLFFGIFQFENFILGFQSAFVAVQLLFTASAYVLGAAQERRSAGRPHVAALVIGIGLGAAAALTMANGAIALLCIACTFALSGWNNRLTFTIAVVGVLVFAAYAFTFTPNPGHTSFGFSLTHPLLVLGHTAMHLGAIFAAPSHSAAIFAGIVAIVSLCAGLAGLASGHVARSRANVTLISIMVFVAAGAALTALGRSSFGVEQAAANRYCGNSAVFWAALVCLMVSVILEKSGKSARYRSTIALAALSSVTVLVVLSTAISQHGYREFGQVWNLAMLRATTALLTGAEDEAALKPVYPDMARLNRFRAILMSRQLSIFADIRPWELGKVIPADRLTANADHCGGRIDKMEDLPSAEMKAMRAEGWSWNTRAKRPFERLVFLSEAGAVSGYARTAPARWVTKLDASAPDRVGSRWYGYVRAGSGPVRIYAILPGEDRLCLLAGPGG